MADPIDPDVKQHGATRRAALGLLFGTPLLGACAGVQSALTGNGSQQASGPQQ
ncbi:MAG: penicillin-binding protein activator, partial [Rhizobiales bacterium]|nr:penicillin-binding protein activator [Hyphomicrobiales bacterium]